MWCYIPVTPALRRLRQENGEFEASKHANQGRNKARKKEKKETKNWSKN
jgi:hypothetical protein